MTFSNITIQERKQLISLCFNELISMIKYRKVHTFTYHLKNSCRFLYAAMTGIVIN